MHDLHHIYPFSSTCAPPPTAILQKNPMPLALSLQLFSNNKDCMLVTQSSPTLGNPMDCSPPCSSVHGIPQARMLEWVAISFSRGSSWSRDRTWVYCIGKWILYYLSHQGRPLEAGYQVAYADLVTDLLYDINLARAKLLLLLLSCFSHVRLCATP